MNPRAERGRSPTARSGLCGVRGIRGKRARGPGRGPWGGRTMQRDKRHHPRAPVGGDGGFREHRQLWPSRASLILFGFGGVLS